MATYVWTGSAGDGAALIAGNLGSAAILVSDSGSTLSASGFVSHGQGCNATLTVQNEGVFLAAADRSGSGGLDIGIGGAITGGGSGGQGSASTQSGGKLSSAGAVLVGGHGASGALSVTGGTVEAMTTMAVGTAPFRAGAATARPQSEPAVCRRPMVVASPLPAQQAWRWRHM